MNRLLEGDRVELPTFNFISGKSEYGKGNFKQIGADDVLVIEGIHCLNDALTYSIPKKEKYKKKSRNFSAAGTSKNHATRRNAPSFGMKNLENSSRRMKRKEIRRTARLPQGILGRRESGIPLRPKKKLI